MDTERIALYRQIRAARADLEAQVKACKEQEDALKQQILLDLEAAGIDSAKVDGYTVSRVTGVRVEIVSHETLQRVMFDRMKAADSDGRPLQDALLLQRTVAKNAALALIRERLKLAETDTLQVSAPEVADQAAALGLRLVPTVDLSLRKSVK